MIARRILGRTGLPVSALAFGTAGLGKADDPGEAARALALAIDSGINAVELDGADAGAAARVAAVLHGLPARDDVHVFARVPSLVPFDLPSPHVTVDRAYPGRHIRASTEALLRALGIERLALAQLHAWCPEWAEEGDAIETLEALRREGKIAGFGLSLFDHDADSGLDMASRGVPDAVQLMYNLFDTGGAEMLLPLCARGGVAAIARAPFYHGALAGHAGRLPDADPAYRREVEARAAAIAQVPGVEPLGLAEVALRFALSHPAVVSVSAGMRTRTHVEANLAAAARGPLPQDMLAALARHKWLC